MEVGYRGERRVSPEDVLSPNDRCLVRTVLPYSMAQMPVPVPASKTRFAPSTALGERPILPRKVSSQRLCCRSEGPISIYNRHMAEHPPFPTYQASGSPDRRLGKSILATRRVNLYCGHHGSRSCSTYCRRSWSGRYGHFPPGTLARSTEET